jgi:hypothetical protein
MLSEEFPGLRAAASGPWFHELADAADPPDGSWAGFQGWAAAQELLERLPGIPPPRRAGLG